MISGDIYTLVIKLITYLTLFKCAINWKYKIYKVKKVYKALKSS